MRVRAETLLAGVEARTLVLAFGGALVVTLLAGYFYMFKGDLRELQRLHRSTGINVERPSATDAARGEALLGALHRQVESLRSRLYGANARPSQAQMTARIIARLDAISARHRVSLAGVKPGTARQVLSFVESPFEVSVSGAYFDLVGWLAEAERELRPLVVKQFEFTPQGNAGGKVSMSLRIAAYLPARGGS